MVWDDSKAHGQHSRHILVKWLLISRGVSLWLPVCRVAKPNHLHDRDGEVFGGAERRIVEGAAGLCPPVLQVRVHVDPCPVPKWRLLASEREKNV